MFVNNYIKFVIKIQEFSLLSFDTLYCYIINAARSFSKKRKSNI